VHKTGDKFHLRNAALSGAVAGTQHNLSTGEKAEFSMDYTSGSCFVEAVQGAHRKVNRLVIQ
jgi:hypothetical protein